MIPLMMTLTLRLAAALPGADAFGFAGPADAGQADRLSGLSMIWLPAVMCVGASALAWAIVAALRRDRARHGPAVRRLATGLWISAARRRLLHRVARAAGLSGPGSLLISRGCFDRAAKRYPARPGERERLHAIRRALFQ